MALLAGWPAPGSAQGLLLTIGSDGTHTLPDGTQVLFKTKQLLRNCDDNVDTMPIRGSTPSYRIYLDENISLTGGYVRYRLIFESSAAIATDELRCQLVQMQPKGPFQDRIDAVPIEVGSGDSFERGELELPLYAISPTTHLEPILDDEPYPIWLGSSNEITFGLKNTNDGQIPSEIDFARVTYDDDLWERDSTAVRFLGRTGGLEDSLVLGSLSHTRPNPRAHRKSCWWNCPPASSPHYPFSCCL